MDLSLVFVTKDHISTEQKFHGRLKILVLFGIGSISGFVTYNKIICKHACWMLDAGIQYGNIWNYCQ